MSAGGLGSSSLMGLAHALCRACPSQVMQKHRAQAQPCKYISTSACTISANVPLIKASDIDRSKVKKTGSTFCLKQDHRKEINRVFY